MPTPDSDADGRSDTGAQPPTERVLCPACNHVSTETDACEYCGNALGVGIVQVYAGP